MRTKLVIANWKMHGSLQKNSEFLADFAQYMADCTTRTVICPPAPYVMQVMAECDDAVANVVVGAQNVCAKDAASGAFTGEASSQMLNDLAVEYCLIGHSERREYFAESNADIAQKFQHLQSVGITPVLCIGEDLTQRKQGKVVEVIEQQLQAVLDVVGIQAFAKSVVAYEPIWAIGTGETATPEQAQEVHQAIRTFFAKLDADIADGLQILYGGSVKADNAKTLFAQPDIDGALVGGASLEAESFSQICKAAE